MAQSPGNIVAYMLYEVTLCISEKKLKMWKNGYNKCIERHQNLGGTIQEHDKHLHQIWIWYLNYFWQLWWIQKTHDGHATFLVCTPQVS